jgi:predicted hotdog family 3-hydroxylacyl-ACP dehydratase
MLIEKLALDALIPHTGAMCLLDAVLNWDSTSILCRTQSHQDPNNPLRTQQGLSALQGVEYGAQAVAVHGALLAPSGGDVKVRGYLVAVRDLLLTIDWLHDVDGPIDVSATLEIDDGRFIAHQFSIKTGSELLISGRVTVLREPG